MTRAARSWIVFAACALAVFAALGWITALALRLQRAEDGARAAARQQEAARVALWRMDTAFTAELLRASGALLLRGGEPSPLFRCGFELGPDAERVLCANDPAAGAAFVRALPRDELVRAVAAATRSLPAGGGATGPEGAPAGPPAGLLPNANVGEYQRRHTQVQQVQGAGWPFDRAPRRADDPAAPVEPLVPLWHDRDRGAELLFVQRDRRDALLGLWADWPAVRTFLLEQVRDLLPGARLRRAGDEMAPDEWRLASVPAVLEAPPPAPAAAGWTPLQLALLVVWVATAAALLATAVVLRAALALGERRGRFVAAVTHELRTPLTTFRLYTQMLAGGMVRDVAAQQEYVATLHGESERLARVVDGVLQFARLENRGVARPAAPLAVAALLEPVVPRLADRAREAGMTLEVAIDEELTNGPDGAAVRIEPQALEQILFNLVDNACKYGNGAADKRVHLRALRRGRRLVLEVEDHGDGVAPSDEAAVFEPFRRGAASGVAATAGVGLGLAIARGMARGLGGDVRVAPWSPGGGARFVVELPLA